MASSPPKAPSKRHLPPRSLATVFGQAPVDPVRVALYARVSTSEQQTLPLQLQALAEHATRRGWEIVRTVQEVGSGATERPARTELLQAARRREVDAILVWRLDRWGRSLLDLIATLRELTELGVGFLSVTEALDLTTTTGRAMAGLLAVFAEFERELLRERVRAGLEHARAQGKHLGRPPTTRQRATEIQQLRATGLSPGAIARRLGVGRTSVRRVLAAGPTPPTDPEPAH